VLLEREIDDRDVIGSGVGVRVAGGLVRDPGDYWDRPNRSPKNVYHST
jgi:hypothetical protein